MLVAWNARGVYGLTGDEPHYLVVADSLVRHHSVDVTQAYVDEFTTRSIYPAGLAPDGVTDVVLPQAHVVIGRDGGTYSFHGLGLPLLLAVPFALGGVVGAQLALIVLGAGIVLLAWALSGLFLSSVRTRFWAVLTVAVAYPLIPASSQIYPDLLAGGIALLGIAMLLARDRRPSWWQLTAVSLAVGFMPWLQVKFLGAALTLLGALAWIVARSRRDWRRLATAVVPAAVLIGTLLTWNVVTFGSLTGAAPGGLELSTTAAMVGLGLLLDQNQGVLVQNLALWVGVFGLASFARRDRTVFVVWTVTFMAIWLPGAMHPVWYGGGSLVGRFSWALAVLMIAPVMAGFGAIRSACVLWSVIGVTIAWNVAHLAFFAAASGWGPSGVVIDLYNNPAGTWLENYAAFAYPLHGWFPALYDDRWAYAFLPNAAWMLLLVGVALAGWRPRIGVPVAAVAAVLVLVGGFVGRAGDRSIEMTHDTANQVVQGLAASGPQAQMRLGSYEWWVAYAATAPGDIAVGRMELFDVASGESVAALELTGSAGDVTRQALVIPVRGMQPREVVLKVWSYGSGELAVLRTGVDGR